MAYNPNNPNGQTTMAASAPVVLASNQSPIPVLESNSVLTTVSGTVTTATSAITAGSGSDVAKAGSVTIFISGTYAGVNVTFEQSPDGTTWYATQGQRTDTGVITASGATGVLTTNATVAYDVTPLLGANQFRVRATAWTSGTANVVIVPAIRAVEISPTVLLAAAQTLATVTTVGTLTTITNGVKAATSTTGGATMFNLVSAATTNATSVKASAGTLYSINCYNNGASACYFKIYNKASAPTVGTDTPVKVIMLPAGGGSNIVAPTMGYNFSLGIAYAITVGAANSDVAAVALSQVLVNGSYA